MPHSLRLSAIRLAMLLALAATGYLVFASTGRFLHSRELRHDQQSIQQQIDELRRQEAKLTTLRDYLRSDEFVENVARHEMGLVKPGETLVIVSSTGAPTPAPSDGNAPAAKQSLTWWERLFER